MLNDKEFLIELIQQARKQDKAYFEFAHITACLLDKKLHESLTQLINGPVYDGDVVSKTDRDILIDLGLAIRVCCSGEQGYTGATYFAFSVMKKANDIKSGKIGA